VLINRMSAGSDSHTMPPAPKPATMDAYWSQLLEVTPAAPRGSKSAPYTIVEFGDFQCPQCGDMRPVLQTELDKLGGKANLMFIQTPLPPSTHPYAIRAAEAAAFAAHYGKFWQMFDLLYTHQNDLEPGNYDQYAESLGLSGDAMRQATETRAYSKVVAKSRDLDDKIGIKVTPTVALRDNRAGKFLWVAEAGTGIRKAFADQGWTLPPSPNTGRLLPSEGE